MRPEDPRDFETQIRALRCELAGARVILAGIRVLLALQRRANFDPAQPRDDRGRWAETGQSITDQITDPSTVAYPVPKDGRVRVAGPFDYGSVDLRLEEGYEDGHTIREHVARSEAYMLARVRGETYNISGVLVVGLRSSGSFSSIQAANALVNATLARNAGIVESVASGVLPKAFVTAEFGSITGSEAYRSSPQSQPYIRTTTGVGVLIYHDGAQLKGFRVHTAFPINE